MPRKDLFLICNLSEEDVICIGPTEAKVLKEANYMVEADGDWNPDSNYVLCKVTTKLQILCKPEIVKSPEK
jgi:hypothetical protein